MKDYLNKLPEELQDLIRLVGDTASCNNMHAYLVGGFVRDLILGVRNLDLDIVIEGDGIIFAEYLAARLQARLIRHKRFRTATVIIKPDLKIDITTARKEFYPEPAHLPHICCGSLKDDLARRDFTINAMAISITGRDFGRLIDIFGGRQDLVNKKICILHDLSFIDDPTRILRGVRFEKRYDFKIEPRTLRCLEEAVRLKMLEKVQPQRLREELILIFKEERPLKQIMRIQELTGLDFIAPKLYVSKKARALLNSIGIQVRWFMREYPLRRQIDAWLIYFMGLTDCLDVKDIKSILMKFVFSKGDEKRILTYKKNYDKLIPRLRRKKVRPSTIFRLFEPLSYEVILMIKAKSGDCNIKRHIEDFFEIYNGMRICICGDDLHKLGVTPGPAYQKIFSKVLNAKLEGMVKTRDEELALIKKSLRLQ